MRKTGAAMGRPGLHVELIAAVPCYESTRTFVACGLLSLPLPTSNETA